MKLKLKKMVAISALMLSSASMMASMKIGLIDMRAVVETSGQAEAMQKSLESEFGAKQKTLRAEIAKFQEDQAKLEKEKPVLSKKVIEQKTKDIQKRAEALSLKQRELQQAAYQKQQAMTMDIMNTIRQAASRVAVKEKLDIVFQQQEVIYSAKSVDITEKVKKEVQKAK